MPISLDLIKRFKIKSLVNCGNVPNGLNKPQNIDF